MCTLPAPPLPLPLLVFGRLPRLVAVAPPPSTLLLTQWLQHLPPPPQRQPRRLVLPPSLLVCVVCVCVTAVGLLGVGIVRGGIVHQTQLCESTRDSAICMKLVISVQLLRLHACACMLFHLSPIRTVTSHRYCYQQPDGTVSNRKFRYHATLRNANTRNTRARVWWLCGYAISSIYTGTL